MILFVSSIITSVKQYVLSGSTSEIVIGNTAAASVPAGVFILGPTCNLTGTPSPP